MRNRSNQCQLRQFIDEISFAMDDIVLFLDTHPCCQEALAYYEECKKMREEAMDEYARMYGPLDKYRANVSESNEWCWALQPWQWKGES